MSDNFHKQLDHSQSSTQSIPIPDDKETETTGSILITKIDSNNNYTLFQTYKDEQNLTMNEAYMHTGGFGRL